MLPGAGQEQGVREGQVEEVIVNLRAEGQGAAQQRMGEHKANPLKTEEWEWWYPEGIIYKESQGSYTESDVCLPFSAQLTHYSTF